MDLKTIKAKVKEHIEQSIAGLSKEDVKFDFKAKWHDLRSKPGINEFLKDTSAIANTFGPDGFLVYGFDDGANEFTQAKFSDSGLRDSNELHGVLVRGMGEVFDLNHYDIEIDGNYLSVLHIPPALNKPFVIKNYQTLDKKGNTKQEQQRIFVRKGTTTGFATKYDLELMYYDRKNITPDYHYQVDVLYLQPLNFNLDSDILKKLNEFQVDVCFSIENLGLRPLCISRIDFNFFYKNEAYDFRIEFGRNQEEYFNSKIIRAKDVKYFSTIVEFESGYAQEIEHLYSTLNASRLEIMIFLTNGKTLRQKIPFRGFE